MWHLRIFQFSLHRKCHLAKIQIFSHEVSAFTHTHTHTHIYILIDVGKSAHRPLGV